MYIEVYVYIYACIFVFVYIHIEFVERRAAYQTLRFTSFVIVLFMYV